MTRIEDINCWSPSRAAEEFVRLCGSHRWVNAMVQGRPFTDKNQILDLAKDIWNKLSADDWLEAFSHHPKIGDLKSLQTRFCDIKTFCQGEQSGINSAAPDILQSLAEGNSTYESKFGYIFIVCASGKSAQEMLSLLQARLQNNPENELRIAMQEQSKITQLRLEKLLS